MTTKYLRATACCSSYAFLRVLNVTLQNMIYRMQVSYHRMSLHSMGDSCFDFMALLLLPLQDGMMVLLVKIFENLTHHSEISSTFNFGYRLTAILMC